MFHRRVALQQTQRRGKTPDHTGADLAVNL